MGKKTVDIDALIATDALTLTLGGKEYTIEDIKMDSFLSVTNIHEGDDTETGMAAHNQLAILFKVPVGELKDVGLKAAALALDEIRQWMLPEQEDSKEDQVDP